MKYKIIFFLSFALLCSGCFSSKYDSYMTAGRTAMDEKRYDQAIYNFLAAEKEKPNDQNAEKLLEQSKAGMKIFLMDFAQNAMEAKNYSQAVDAYTKASTLYPNNKEIKALLENAKNALHPPNPLPPGSVQSNERTVSFTTYTFWSASQNNELEQINSFDLFSSDSTLSDKISTIQNKLIPQTQQLLSDSQKPPIPLGSELQAIHNVKIEYLQQKIILFQNFLNGGFSDKGKMDDLNAKCISLSNQYSDQLKTFATTYHLSYENKPFLQSSTANN